MSENKSYSYSEYIEEYPKNRRAREYWKLFKVKGPLDSRHVSYYLCEYCSNQLYNNKEKLTFEVDADGNLACVKICFKLCEDCIERNIYETNTYIYKYSLKHKARINNTIELDDKEEPDIPTSSKKVKKTSPKK